MKKFYSVITRFYDSGRLTANMGDTIEAETIPDNTHEDKEKYDFYIDWFTSEKAAKNFIGNAKNA